MNKEIARWIHSELGISLNLLRSGTRKKEIVLARHVFSGIAKKFNYSTVEIGRYLQRDHTTVMHGLAKGSRSPAISVLIEKGYECLSVFKESLGDVVNNHGKGFSKTNSRRWAGVYEKYGGVCAACGFSSVVEVHHIVSRSMGGSDDINNLILPCPNHHAMIERGLVFFKDLHRNYEENNGSYNNRDLDIFNKDEDTGQMTLVGDSEQVNQKET